MWLFPLLAALVALAFSALLVRRWLDRRRPHEAAWAMAMLMYAGASFALVLGVTSGWSDTEYRAYWLLGAVLNVPFLAMGELLLLVRNRTVRAGLWILLIFVSAYALNIVRTAALVQGSLAAELPSGKDVFGAGSPAHRLPQWISIPSYLVLLGGALWSALRMRAAPSLRDRFLGTLTIAGGATIVAVLGSAFAAAGDLPAFSISLLAGIGAMFWGFVRASRPLTSARTSTDG